MIKYTYSRSALGWIINATRWVARDRKETESGGENIYIEQNKWESNSKRVKQKHCGGGGGKSHKAIVNISFRERMEMLWIYIPHLFSGYCFHRQRFSSRAKLRGAGGVLSHLVNQSF